MGAASEVRVVTFALRHPLQAWRYLRSPYTLSGLIGNKATPSEFKGWMREANKITVETRLRLAGASWSPGQITGATNSHDRGPILYALTRALTPKLVVETGVANGSSTYYLLAAMEANGCGKLHSVDLPPGQDLSTVYRKNDMTALPKGQGPGWLVPMELRPRWQLHLGDTRVILPKVFDALTQVDFFFHDSEHTYEAMSFEYSLAWSHLSSGGILGSDDVNWNHAFSDFVTKRRLPKALVGGFGFTVKPSTETGSSDINSQKVAGKTST